MFKRCSGFVFPVSPCRVLILGGSFNPVHKAHLAITRQVARLFDLNFSLWVICNYNPVSLKSAYLPMDARVALSTKMIGSDKIVVGVSGAYAIDTINSIRLNNPRCNFVWLMGDDSWVTLRKWRRWRDFVKAVPIVVFQRKCSIYAVRSVRKDGFCGVKFPVTRNGTWTIINSAVFLESSTDIRCEMMRNNSFIE